eukprot:10469091-Alexandrium_andersonii.AAC.1
MTEARTSPRVAPAANRARMRSGASRRSVGARKRRPSDPSWGRASLSCMRFMSMPVSSSMSSVFASGVTSTPMSDT